MSFEADSLKEHQENLFKPYWYDPTLTLLKTLALYGHNSYGKTNLIKGYSFMLKCIFNSFDFTKKEGYIKVEKFRLDDYSLNNPTKFSIVFIIEKVKYRYRFSINDGKVVEEELWYAESRVRENYLFSRVEGEIRISKLWNKDSKGQVESSKLFTKSHNLFLSVLISQNNIPHVEAISVWLRKSLFLSDDLGAKEIKDSVVLNLENEYRKIIHQFLEKADLGFLTVDDKIESKESNPLGISGNFLKFMLRHEIKNFELYTRHIIYDQIKKPVDDIFFELLKNESAGSIKYFILACHLTFALKEGLLLIIDEIDSKLHDDLIKILLSVFNNPKYNVKGAQLLFSLHNTSILKSSIFRRDQVLFVTKDSYGESGIKKVHSPDRPIRASISFEKIYLSGEFGGSSPVVKANASLPEFDFGEGK